MDSKALLVTFFVLAVIGVAIGVAWVVMKDHAKHNGGGDGAGARLLDKLLNKAKK